MPKKIEFDQKDRDEIKTLAGYGLTFEEIATIKNCHRETLAKHCSDELAEGKVSAKAIAINRLFDLIKKNNITAIIFYLKTQHAWKETQVVQSEETVNYVLSDKPLTIEEFNSQYTKKSEAVKESE